MNGYELTRNWYAFKFENPSRVRAVHSDMYFYIVDLWNRLGQKKEIGLPTSVSMEALGIGGYNTYKKTLSDLMEFGFIKLVKESHNQHHSKIIALSIFDKATDKPLDKATIKAMDKATIKAMDKATDSIIEPKNKEPLTNTIEQRKLKFADTLNPFLPKYESSLVNEFFSYWTEPNQKGDKMRFEAERFFEVGKRLATWDKNEKKFSGAGQNFDKPKPANQNKANIQTFQSMLDALDNPNKDFLEITDGNDI